MFPEIERESITPSNDCNNNNNEKKERNKERKNAIVIYIVMYTITVADGRFR